MYTDTPRKTVFKDMIQFAKTKLILLFQQKKEETQRNVY